MKDHKYDMTNVIALNNYEKATKHTFNFNYNEIKILGSGEKHQKKRKIGIFCNRKRASSNKRQKLKIVLNHVMKVYYQLLCF